MKPKRRIIQLTAIPDTEDNYSKVLALCDDGTVWGVSGVEGSQWESIDVTAVTCGNSDKHKTGPRLI